MTLPSSAKSTPRIAPADIVDIFVYVVVINLAVEYFPLIITETFTLSLLTAVLLKVVLEGVVWAKNRGKARFKAATTRAERIGAGLLMWALAFGSKFVVLELVAFFFADQVKLGGFFAVTGLVILLLICRAGVRRLLDVPARSAVG